MKVRVSTENVVESKEHTQTDSLGVWLQKAEAIGEVKKITAEVDPDLEMSTVAYLSGKEAGSPALLFENIKAHPGHRALYNMLGNSINRVALAIREEPGQSGLGIVKVLKEKMKRRMPPKVVAAEDASVNRNTELGEDVDLTQFPAPKMWPLDGGKYIGTADAVITQNPDSGRTNLGTYRHMIKSRDQVGFYVSPGKDALLDREAWWNRGEPAPVAAVYGLDPLLFIVSATTFPKNASEYESFGGINGAPIEVFKSDVTGLMLPANAEIIIEGFTHPDKTFPEGPFGEFTGYYGRPSGPTPYIDVHAVRYKKDPILTCALMADGIANECGLFWGMSKAAKVWADLQALGVPGVQGVWSPPEAAGWGVTVVSIKQLYAGHAAQTMALAAQCMGGAYFTKYVIVVDDDVDPSNLSDVLWALATRSRPAQAIDILRETWSTYLDPSLNPPEIRPWGSKCLINACKEFRHIKEFARRTKLSKPVYEQVVERWKELGFEDEPPKVDAFEGPTVVSLPADGGA
ncbi:MAG: UbiD family decarboxylase [Nitrospinota bacterium]